MMFHRVKTVSALPNYHLMVQFEDGTKKRYDVAPLFSKWNVFDSLRSVHGLFDQVRVDTGGYGIIWNDDLDLSCNELWDNGQEVRS